MVNYTEIKDIEDVNIFRSSEYFNPCTNRYEYLIDGKKVEIEPDLSDHANGNIVVKMYLSYKTYKIEFSYMSDVWVCEKFVTYNIYTMMEYLGLTDKEMVIFIQAVKKCRTYEKSGLGL